MAERTAQGHYFYQCDSCRAQTLLVVNTGNTRETRRELERISVDRGWILTFDGGPRHYCSQKCAENG